MREGSRPRDPVLFFVSGMETRLRVRNVFAARGDARPPVAPDRCSTWNINPVVSCLQT